MCCLYNFQMALIDVGAHLVQEERMSNSNQNNESDDRGALEIVNDPKYHITAESAPATEKSDWDLSRRDLLKYSSATAAALSVAGAAATGFATGRSADGYTGYGRQFLGKDQFFNREPFRADVAAMMEPVGEVTRADWHDYYLRRWKDSFGLIVRKIWSPADGVDKMPGHLGEFYRSDPEKYKNFVESVDLLMRHKKYIEKDGGYDRYALNLAYKAAHQGSMTTFLGYSIPEDPADALRITGKIQPPEEWDFRHVKKDRKKLEFKSPQHAAEFVKTMAHRFGASFVGLTDLAPEFVYKNVMRGYPNLGVQYGDKIPEHWKNIIVYAVPMEWDNTQAAGGFFTAFDGYFRIRIIGGLLERFLQELGYAARAQTPVTTYEVMITPYVLKSGLGEYARAGFAMIPEVGSNFRSAGIITDLEFEYDKPININMAKFCQKCKICADTCPSGAIETSDEPTQIKRGFKRWVLDQEKCFHGWQMTGGQDCGTCIAVCPFTRKNTWIHAISRELDARDRFGIVGEGLLAMQLNFFKYPTAEEFRGKHHNGEDAVYHNPLKWMKTEEWFSNVTVDWEYNGMH